MSENEVCKIQKYRDLVYEALPNLQVLDGHDRDGESFISDQDEYGNEEEGEFEMDDNLQEIINGLDPETR